MPWPSGRPSKPSLPAERPHGALQALQLSLFGTGPGVPAGADGREPALAPERRYAKLGGRIVTWELRRARRRTIGFRVDERGLRISAPRWVTLSEIDRAMAEKASWILRKLDEWREHAARRERLAPRWEDGALIHVLGERLVLRVDPTHRGVSLGEGELRVGLPAGTSPEQLQERVQVWLKQHARTVFAPRIAFYAERLGRSPKRWALSSARTRWGSCSADGTVRLSWRLIHFPLHVVDYVVAHELAHLGEMNHGPRFWSTVAQLCPDYERARAWLRQFPDEAPSL
jgi:predicted metal-dependent hydrolase